MQRDPIAKGAQNLINKVNKIKLSNIESKIDTFVDKAINKLENIENGTPSISKEGI